MPQTHHPKYRLKLIYSIAICFTLIVFTATVLVINLKLRSAIKQQIVNRDAEMILLFSQINKRYSGELYLSAMLSAGDFNGNGVANSAPLSKLQGIIAMQVFNAEGKLQFSIPDNLSATSLTAEDLSSLRQRMPVSRFYPEIWLDSLFNDARFIINPTPSPLLEITVPVFENQDSVLPTFVQYWIDGSSMAGELEELDRNVIRQTAVALGCGYLIIIAILTWAFLQLHNTLEKLKQQTVKLTDANRELVIAAKSSAVGAVSAYLLHGIKSPLTGLQDFITSQTALLHAGAAEDLDEWQTAVDSTRRIYHLVQEIIQIIQEEDNPEGYELSLGEICDLLKSKTGPLAQQMDVCLELRAIPDLILANRTGNLLVLILDNLVKNAIEATAAGKKVTLTFNHQPGSLVIDVSDQGRGLPETIRHNLFKPCSSSKPNGNGIGLAISHQLSQHIGAALTLKKTDASGTCFSLKLPLEVPIKI